MRAIIVFGILAIFATGYQGQQNHAKPSDVQTTSNGAPKQSPQRGTQPAPRIQQKSCYETARDYLRKAVGPEYLAAWVLVLAAGIGLYATFNTLGILREQTAATKNAAEATLINAKAFITQNRPWLLIVSSLQENGIQKPFLEPVEEDMGKRMTHAIFYMKNYGNTPARVFASNAELQLGDSVVGPPDFQVYDMEKAKHEVVTFPPGESIPHQAILMPLGFIKAEDRDKAIHGGKYLWLCGFFKYRDTFERQDAPEHETRFCYLYENRFNTPEPFWKPAGPPGYNTAN